MPKKRHCLPCPLRERYVQAVAKTVASPITVGCKNRYIDEFMKFCLEHFGHADPRSVTREQFHAFADHLCDSLLKTDSARQKIRELMGWFAWLEAEGEIQSNPTRDMKAADLVKRTKRGW